MTHSQIKPCVLEAKQLYLAQGGARGVKIKDNGLYPLVAIIIIHSSTDTASQLASHNSNDWGEENDTANNTRVADMRGQRGFALRVSIPFNRQPGH